MDYIIVEKNGKPLHFPDGDVIIYGDKQEAINDCTRGDKLAQLDYQFNGAFEIVIVSNENGIIGQFNCFKGNEANFQTQLWDFVDCNSMR